MKKIFVKTLSGFLAVSLSITFLLVCFSAQVLAAPSTSRNITFGAYNLQENNTISDIAPGTTLATFRTGVTLLNQATLSAKALNGDALDESTVITSGTTFEVTSGVTATSYTALIYGDCDNNGVVGVNDLAALKSHLLRINLFDAAEIKSVDFFFKNTATISNLLVLKKHIMNITTISQDIMPNVDKIVTTSAPKGSATIITSTPNQIGSPSYLAMQGNFTNEIFEFTTTIKDGTSPNLVIGARMAGLDNNPDKNNGVTLRMYDGFFELYAPKFGWWTDAVGLSLSSNTEYTFKMHVTTVGALSTIHLQVLQGTSEVLNYNKDLTSGIEASPITIPESGSFVVWSLDQTTDISYKLVRDVSTVVASNGVAASAQIITSTPNNVAKTAYLAMQGSYTNETYEFTTTIKDGAKPNLVIGARMAGINNNPDQFNGVSIHIYGGFFELYAPKYGWWNAAAGLTLSSNTEYTFGIVIETINSVSTLNFTVKQGNTTILNYSKVITANIPASGSFVVWSMDETRDISYQMPRNIVIPQLINKVVASNETFGTATVKTLIQNEVVQSAYLAMQGSYTNETFEFTTIIKDGTKPNLVIGARMAGFESNPDKFNGVCFRLYNGFFELYAPKYGWWTDAVGLSLTSNTEYTFKINVTTAGALSNFHLIVLQGATQVLDYSKDLTSDGNPITIPESGSFVVWSMDDTRDINYHMPSN